MVDSAAARQFVMTNARLIDRVWFTVLFDGGVAGQLLSALASYQNADGGYGYGLEPDTRTPESQPLNVEIAWQYMASAEAVDEAAVRRACDWLQSVSAPGGGVPILVPGFEAYPHAAHWSTYDRPPELVPNGGLVGAHFAMGIDHPWRARTAELVWKWIESPEGIEVHDMLDAVWFLEAVPDRERATKAAERLSRGLSTTTGYKPDPASPGYGVTPLWFAPSPDSFCRPWFSDSIIQSNLDNLAAEQQSDGGWPITWNPPGPASVLEWRGIQTMKALRTLQAYSVL
ncbi:hypothetical protein AYO38_07480 [bacterium SCGC AG-212-C10]|nr:hypothetical protein AYO38_07480 [bacterium SCGC AG-212-C10]